MEVESVVRHVYGLRELLVRLGLGPGRVIEGLAIWVERRGEWLCVLVALERRFPSHLVVGTVGKGWLLALGHLYTIAIACVP